jgi:hypothetical protein
MARALALGLTCLVLTLGGTACTPPLVGPTPGAGYRGNRTIRANSPGFNVQ